MQLRKHFLFIACAVLCVFSLCALPSSAYADEALGADAEAAVAARMREIGNRYEVGDILSEDDARFVRDHLRLSTQPQPRESWTFTKTGSGVESRLRCAILLSRRYPRKKSIRMLLSRPGPFSCPEATVCGKNSR